MSELGNQLAYTITKDYKDLLVVSGVDLETANLVSGDTYEFVTGSRATYRKTLVPKKSTKLFIEGIDLKEKNLSPSWSPHPGHSEYEYTKDIPINEGYPLRNKSTGKIIGILSTTEVRPVTRDEGEVLIALGLEVE